MQQAESIATDWGYEEIVCSVDPNNRNAMSLYTKRGYKAEYISMTTVQANLMQQNKLFDVMMKSLR